MVWHGEGNIVKGVQSNPFSYKKESIQYYYNWLHET